jgi:hypothetical protein
MEVHVSEPRVPLTSVIPTRRLATIQVNEDLATRFTHLNAAASDRLSELGDAFYQAFLDEVTKDENDDPLRSNPLVELLVRLSTPMNQLSPERLDEPLFSPVIGRAEALEPEKGDPLRSAYAVAFGWLIGVLGGRWQVTLPAAGGVRPVDDRAKIPYWFIYCLLELARKYVVDASDRASSPVRAGAWLYVGHTPDEWHLGRPRYQTEKVFLEAPLWLRRSTESREQFLLRVIENVLDSALGQIVPEAESMDRYVEEIGLPYESGRLRADLDRARECARVILGKVVPSGGTGQQVRDRLLIQLGFLLPPED